MGDQELGQEAVLDPVATKGVPRKPVVAPKAGQGVA